jgi:predicted P-loop ATPase
MSTISSYPLATEVDNRKDISIHSFLNNIRDGEYQDIVFPLRARLAKTSDGKARQAEKVSVLPAVCLSGTFAKRNNEGLLAHSGFIGIDIDGENPDDVKRRVRGDKYVYSVFTSCSGTGACLIFKILPDRHLDSFNGIAEYLLTNYGLIADQSCKNVSRLRFVSYDPDIYIEDHAVVFKQFPKGEKKPKLISKEVVFIQSDFEAILDQITFDITGGYHQWLKIGFAIASHFGEPGREYFHRISKFGNYSEKTCDKQYTECLKGRGDGITIATFYWICKENNIPVVSEIVQKISRRAATHKKAHSTLDQSINNIIKFPGEIEASDELITDVATQVFNKAVFIPDVSDIEAGRIWLRGKNLRWNVITGQCEKDGRPMEDKEYCNLRLEMREALPELIRPDINDLMGSDAISSYHEIFKYFEDNQNAGRAGAIAELAACLNSPTGEGTNYVELMLTKWLVGAIANLYEHPTYGYSALMLVLCGEKHGKGKSSFFTRLLPFDKYTALKDFSNLGNSSFKRDMDIAITTNWLVWDDELGGKSKRDHRLIKAMLSTASTNARAAYGKNDKQQRRIAFFGGTSNDLNIIPEHGEQRRIVPIEIESVDFEKKDRIFPVDYIMEAYNLYHAGYNYTVLDKDIKFLNEHTDQFKEIPTLEAIMSTKFEPEPGITIKNAKDHIGITIPDILVRVKTLWPTERVNATSLGIALKGIGCIQYINRNRETKKTERQWFVREKDISIDGLRALGKILAASGDTLPF